MKPLKGDSGGPLNCYLPDKNQYVLCAMVSWGIPQLCGLNKSLTRGVPEVYARIKEYLGWIDANTDPVNIVQTELGSRVQLKCQFQGNINYSGCQFFDAKGAGPLINLFTRRKRRVTIQNAPGELKISFTSAILICFFTVM